VSEPSFDLELSHEGTQRRESILALARDLARQRRHRRRRVVASAISGSLVLVMIVTTMSVLRHAQPPKKLADVSRPLVVVPAIAPPPSSVTIIRLQTDPSITSRLALVPAQRDWRKLDDDELLRVLADAGKPSGLIEFDGRGVLVPRRTTNR
jgi:hypothetical protein